LGPSNTEWLDGLEDTTLDSVTVESLILNFSIAEVLRSWSWFCCIVQRARYFPWQLLLVSGSKNIWDTHFEQVHRYFLWLDGGIWMVG
jgi:hypothetical protein